MLQGIDWDHMFKTFNKKYTVEKLCIKRNLTSIHKLYRNLRVKWVLTKHEHLYRTAKSFVQESSMYFFFLTTQTFLSPVNVIPTIKIKTYILVLLYSRFLEACPACSDYDFRLQWVFHFFLLLSKEDCCGLTMVCGLHYWWLKLNDLKARLCSTFSFSEPPKNVLCCLLVNLWKW